MDKFLFTDGTNGVREAQSQQELENFIATSIDPSHCRIWIFSNNEWISYSAYRKLVPVKRESAPVAIQQSVADPGAQRKRGVNWGKRLLYLTGAGAMIFLVFNFTKLKWERADPVSNMAARPANVPQMDIDSLISQIEESRFQPLDRSTRNNLRLRNTWPDKILLELKSDRESNGRTSRFFNLDIAVDNATGFPIDKAVVKFQVWKDNQPQISDTVQFHSIGYEQPSHRKLEFRYTGDSISVSFESIKAKAFNFCYSAAVKNNSGNYNDRWFCRQ